MTNEIRVHGGLGNEKEPSAVLVIAGSCAHFVARDFPDEAKKVIKVLDRLPYSTLNHVVEHYKNKWGL